ncbi:hypothetical protein PsorP6_001820 [Peronosclerospora sorghi]|uniref:Uncharacterized protein n=1 Tax=Peronosclerospora sorghi TaxID=230839 RepID=A0ACC0WQU3_9STRA|nr:hypothetical protein PsorP6_001820 [Peronosclerospora sorghi]
MRLPLSILVLAAALVATTGRASASSESKLTKADKKENEERTGLTLDMVEANLRASEGFPYEDVTTFADGYIDANVQKILGLQHLPDLRSRIRFEKEVDPDIAAYLLLLKVKEKGGENAIRETAKMLDTVIQVRRRPKTLPSTYKTASFTCGKLALTRDRRPKNSFVRMLEP